ncbi:MAG: hypothetical protein KGO92_11080 [Bacteroidota bacterium]|nr:hypothetical protein [Bacteroidota bacterium]
MQRILVISLLAVHLFGNTEICQLLNIPLLFDHYQYHHLQPGNEELSFLGFVWTHYITNDADQNDNTQDSQLPFLHYSHPFSLVAVSPPATYLGVGPLDPHLSVTAGAYINGNVLKDFTNGLLRPPRLI